MKALVMLLGLLFLFFGAGIGIIANISWSVLDLKERITLVFLSLLGIVMSGVCFYPIFFNID